MGGLIRHLRTALSPPLNSFLAQSLDSAARNDRVVYSYLMLGHVEHLAQGPFVVVGTITTTKRERRNEKRTIHTT
jgi:hypothetical protein